MPTLETREVDSLDIEEAKKKTIEVLEDPNYNWRTIDGISDATSLRKDIIKEVLSRLESEGMVIRSLQLDSKGRAIFTTWKHYKKSQGFINRFLTTITGKIK